MEQTSRFRLPMLIAGQGQKDITHNEALVLLDAAIFPLAERRDLLVPPEDAVEGQCWLVPAGASLSWDGRADQLAIWTAGGWRFLALPDGAVVFVKAEGLRLRRAGAQWHLEVPIGAPGAQVELPAGGLVVDVEARMALGQLVGRLTELGLIRT